jgi:hypothetical protein
MQAYNTVSFKHLLTQDVVKIMPFNKPNFPQPADIIIPCGKPPGPFDTESKAMKEAAKYGLKGFYPSDVPFNVGGPAYFPGAKADWNTLSLENISTARSFAKTILKQATAGSAPVSLRYKSPSPVFPDMIAIPLMSMERCYGPWLSASQLDSGSDARVKYSNIGGKVEFIKDENLSPWSYAGYQLLDEAGALQANFSNSLLLFSERGGFVMPDAPTGIALATALQAEGPLITSVGITVDEQAGVKTTVKMDLYTSQFGRLAKQKELAISQAARQRQKTLDQDNALIRRGLGKSQTSADLVSTVMNAGGNDFLKIVNGITNQVETNRELGEDIDEMIIVSSPDGGSSTMMTTKAYEKMKSAWSDSKDIDDVVTSAASLWTTVMGSNAGIPPLNVRAITNRINGNNN